MKRRIHNDNFPSEIRDHYNQKREEIEEKYEEYKQMTGQEPVDSKKNIIQMNDRLFRQVFQSLENNESTVQIEWLEPAIVSTHKGSPQLNFNRKRYRYDFRYEYWFQDQNNL